MDTRSSAPLAARRRLGHWLPANETAVAAFRKRIAAQVQDQQVVVPLLPVVQELAALVNEDPVLRMGFTQAIDEALARGYQLGYTNVDELMVLINHVMTYAPPFSNSDLVGCPLNALLDWPM